MERHTFYSELLFGGIFLIELGKKKKENENLDKYTGKMKKNT